MLNDENHILMEIIVDFFCIFIMGAVIFTAHYMEWNIIFIIWIILSIGWGSCLVIKYWNALR